VLARFANFVSGELTVRYSDAFSRLRKRRQVFNPSALNMYVLVVRAYDLGKETNSILQRQHVKTENFHLRKTASPGVPHRYSTTQVKIFPPDSGTRLLNFLLPANGMNYEKMEELLTKITGGQVTVLEVNSYRPQRFRRAITEGSRKLGPNEKWVSLSFFFFRLFGVLLDGCINVVNFAEIWSSLVSLTETIQLLTLNKFII
jgi:hypothetical protein